MATRTRQLIVDPRTGKMVDEYKEDLMAVALFDQNITTRPEDYKFRFVQRSEFTVAKINLLFECNAALLKDPFGNVIWPKDWMTQVLPPNGTDRWYYIIHEPVEPIPQDDLHDPLYTGGALLVLAFVPAQCESIDIRTWLLFGITQEFQPLLRLKPLVATSQQKLKVLKEKIKALPVMDIAGSQQEQIETRKNLANAMNDQATELTNEIKELERRRKRMTKLIVTEPVTFSEVPRDAELPSTSIKNEVETKTWAATFTSPRGRDLASLALNKNDWNYVCLVQTRPQPRAFFEDDQLSNQTIDPDDLLKEINMRAVKLRRIRHGEGELMVPTAAALAADEDKVPLDPIDKHFHFSSIGGVYSGAFRLGQKHGQGQEYTNVGVYTGHFSGNTSCGNGKLVYGKGTTCEGTFDRPQRRYVYSDKLRGRAYGNSLLNGDDYRDGAESGEMHVKFPDGATYDGEMKDGVISGPGRYVSSTGMIDEGLFVNGVLHGPACTRTFPDGSFVEGTFVEGQPHGRGRQRDRHGDKYEGFFDGGARHGRGTTRFEGGRSKHVGFWHEDTMDGRGDFYYRLYDKFADDEPTGDTGVNKEKWDFWYEGEFMQNETRSRHRHEDLRDISEQQHQDKSLDRHLPFTTSGKSFEKMPFLAAVLPTQLDKLRRRKVINEKRRTGRERSYLQQCELENITMYYSLLDDFYEEWTKRKRKEHGDNLLDGDELRRVQEEREALRIFQEQRARFRKEKYDLSSRKTSLVKFEEYLDRVTLTERVKLKRAEAADWVDMNPTNK
ncbi:MORN repeat [Phytophthora infestans]|uniref:MORN repeat n=1 Tax=Phytophthora infestans TaxID=4787 RepID=A0A833SMK9_PHYIN|nr:MORN repeat [Phytophthora infestans]KAF4136117.1 MORN repeat domain-containing protein [Phytophthora infestans]